MTPGAAPVGPKRESARAAVIALFTAGLAAATGCGAAHPRHPDMPPPEYEEPAPPSMPVTDAGPSLG